MAAINSVLQIVFQFGGNILRKISITSAFQFLKIAHDYKKNRNHPSEIEFYRGHSDKEWRLLPSIYRKYLLGFEERLIDEFIRRRPNEFSDGDGLFNIVAKMQHYGLHTRLLDVTENPAVALYFACYNDFDKDGELFIFQLSLDDIPNNTVLNIMTEFYIRQTNDSKTCNLKAYYDHLSKIHKRIDVEMAFYFIANGYYCIARPKIISERILRQSGSFMLFANEVCPKENCLSEQCIHRDTDMCKKDNISTDIYERLYTLRIRSLLRDYKDPQIKYGQNGCRFIVKAESKKEILYELQTLGINKAFLFPELSNEGLDIMEDYCSRLGLKNTES